jgi:hypothetical protein
MSRVLLRELVYVGRDFCSLLRSRSSSDWSWKSARRGGDRCAESAALSSTCSDLPRLPKSAAHRRKVVVVEREGQR